MANNAKVILRSSRLKSRLAANKAVNPVQGAFLNKKGEALPDVKMAAHTDRNKNSMFKPGYHTRRNFEMAKNGYTTNGKEASLMERTSKAALGAHRYMWKDANATQRWARNGALAGGIVGIGAIMDGLHGGYGD